MSSRFTVPSDKEIEDAALAMCKRIGGDIPASLLNETWQGLADYMKIVIAIHARIANAEWQDRDSEPDMTASA